MSGHSKWATIKRQKGANDAKRGQLFTKLSNAITIAVRQGGGTSNPDDNPRLRLAVDAARAANMPKENIERAISRAAGKSGQDLEEAVYEGFGPGGFSVIVEAYTDNKQRTVSEVKNVFDKNGGSLGAQGSVMYQFEKKGVIAVDKGGKSIDEIFMIAVDCFAEDVEDAENEVLIYTKPEDLMKSRNALTEQGLNPQTAELIWKPIVITAIEDSASADKALSFLEKIESLDDVQKVYANFDIPENIMQQVSLHE